jgi:hypothetical protein
MKRFLMAGLCILTISAIVIGCTPPPAKGCDDVNCAHVSTQYIVAPQVQYIMQPQIVERVIERQVVNPTVEYIVQQDINPVQYVVAQPQIQYQMASAGCQQNIVQQRVVKQRIVQQNVVVQQQRTRGRSVNIQRSRFR